MINHPVPIPRGNTQSGVLKSIFRILREDKFKSFISKARVLDVPCGQGEFLATFKKIYPQSNVVGLDLFAQPLAEIESNFIRSDMRNWSALQGQTFDLITCISGVMQCDDVMGLFEKSNLYLRPGGYLFVTNDNVVTVRDRISFLLFGHVKRFRKFFDASEGNWNVVLPQALMKFFKRYNYEEIEVIYCSTRFEDWLFLPFAMPFYLLDLLYALVAKSRLSCKERIRLYPFKSLIARHYIIIGRKP